MGSGGVCCGGGKFGRPAATPWRRLGRGGVAGMARLYQQVGVLAQPIAGTFDLYDDRMVKQPIKQRSGDDGITKNFAPLGKSTIGRQNHCALLVAGVDQLEE